MYDTEAANIAGKCSPYSYCLTWTEKATVSCASHTSQYFLSQCPVVLPSLLSTSRPTSTNCFIITIPACNIQEDWIRCGIFRSHSKSTRSQPFIWPCPIFTGVRLTLIDTLVRNIVISWSPSILRELIEASWRLSSIISQWKPFIVCNSTRPSVNWCSPWGPGLRLPR